MIDRFDSPRAPNWIGDRNPWLMPRPPGHWLRRLWDRDCALRVLPGLTVPCYRIGRTSRAIAMIAPAQGLDSETGRMCRERLVPVVTLKANVVWNDDFFLWLDASDTWAVSDAAAVIAQNEAADARRLDAAITDELDQRSVSAFDALKWRTGQQVLVQTPEKPSCSPVVDEVTTDVAS